MDATLEKRAFAKLGDRDAIKACTDEGYLLSCPRCGSAGRVCETKDRDGEIHQVSIRCENESKCSYHVLATDEPSAVKSWNANRPDVCDVAAELFKMPLNRFDEKGSPEKDEYVFLLSKSGRCALARFDGVKEDDGTETKLVFYGGSEIDRLTEDGSAIDAWQKVGAKIVMTNELEPDTIAPVPEPSEEV